MLKIKDSTIPMNLKIFLNLFLFSFLLFYPITSYSAEVLQINRYNQIIIGDQNRKLPIKLPCIHVAKDNEKIALDLLRKKFPRGTKVKIKPLGLSESILSAKVYDLSEEKEMSQVLIANDLSENLCNDI